MQFTARKLAFGVFALVLIGISFTGLFRDHATEYLNTASKDNLLSLGIVLELEFSAKALESSKIPILSGGMAGVVNTLGKAQHYLLVSNVMISLQMVLLKLSHFAVFKILALLALVLVYFKVTANFATKALILILFLNPGLSIYVSGIEYISKEAELNLGDGLHSQLAEMQLEVSKHDSTTSTPTTTIDPTAAPKHESFLKREEEKIEGGVKKVVKGVERAGASIVRDVKASIQALKTGGKKLIQLCLNLVVHVLALFLVLPFLYFIMFNWLLRGLLVFSSWPDLVKTVKTEGQEALHTAEKGVEKVVPIKKDDQSTQSPS